MTNPKQKAVVSILFILILGFGIYNIKNPYDKRTNKTEKETTPSYSTFTSNRNTYKGSTSTYSNSTSNWNTYKKNTPSFGNTISSSNAYKKSSPSKNDLLLEQYRNNSLRNGAQPYSTNYGYNSSYGDSEITVNASYNSDVIVIVKKRNSDGPVACHAYITKGNSYTFTIPAGTYQTFFYYGKSWCPEKEMANGVKGGFLEDEVFSKDDSFYIDDYQILTYTLTLQRNGNFRTDPSSESEIF